MRLRALKDLNIREVDISLVQAKDEAIKIKYALSDNDRMGQYDEQALAELTYPHIEEINLEDYKLDIGEPISLKDVIEDYAPDIDGEDEVPEIDDSPAITKMGDLFMLGKHRLLCGDATKEEDVRRLMGGEKADMVFTDPPYNVGYTGGPPGAWSHKKHREIEGDKQGIEDWGQFIKKMFEVIFKFNEGAIYVCMSNKELPFVTSRFKEMGGHFSTFIIWHKTHFTLSMSDYQKEFEPILYGWKEGGKHHFCGERNLGDVWTISRPMKSDEHPVMKPIKLCKRAIGNSSKENDLIVDFFGGAGSTLLASEEINRKCNMLEIEPKYCDVIITRYVNFTDTPEEEIRATRQ